MIVIRMRTVRRIVVATATATLCVAVMGVAATRDRAPGMDEAQAPRMVLSSPVSGLAAPGGGLREEAGMLVAGMVLIGAAAAVRRAA